MRGLFDQLSCIYPPPKMYAFVADGSKSKNARQRTGNPIKCIVTLMFSTFTLYYVNTYV